MNLARPSSTGSASELTLLAGRISEQQCCMEIDSVSKVHRVPTWRDVVTTYLLQQRNIFCSGVRPSLPFIVVSSSVAFFFVRVTFQRRRRLHIVRPLSPNPNLNVASTTRWDVSETETMISRRYLPTSFQVARGLHRKTYIVFLCDPSKLQKQRMGRGTCTLDLSARFVY